jgi:hypothetical protein
MSRERRYTDDEVRAIFGAASDDPPGDDGGEAREADIDRRGSDLTLVQLRDIAAEVGLDPERVASAALALDQADAARGRVPAVDRARGEVETADRLPLEPARRTRLGAPLAVGKVVDLPRPPTDAEWQILVGEMREMFGARGELSASGALRDWSNGNLHISVEPTEEGHRLRLATLKGSAAAGEATGLAMGAFGILLAAMLLFTGEAEGALMLGGILGGSSALYLGGNAILLPRWARERRDQFERIGERARELLTDE